MVARAVATLVPAVLLAGCSIILDPDNLPPPTDAAPPSIDADPSLLGITGVAPAELLEGTGTGGRPALLVLSGTSLVRDADVTVHLEGGAMDVTEVHYLPSLDGTRAGVSFRLPVLIDLAAGETRQLKVTVTQGAATDSIEVDVRGLDQVMLPPIPSPIAPLYSQITVSGSVHFTGNNPIKLVATAGIDVGGVLDVDAETATPGPHGCGGGGAVAAGGCGMGGGHAGTSAALGGSGGGGGSFGDRGASGFGTTPGIAGDPTGNPMIVPLVSGNNVAGNRGNGGGGAGSTLGGLGEAGGVGGAGGGVIYLAAGGDVTVMAGGSIEAKGGAGGVGSGGGGGGAGGAIVVRAGGLIRSTSAWLSAPGGLGGMGHGGGATAMSRRDGGAGGPGRIRADAAGGSVAGVSTTPAPARGPSWDAAIDSLEDRRLADVTLTLRGESGTVFALQLNDDVLPMSATPGAGGTATVRNLPLEVGRNVLCAVADPAHFEAESVSCLELFYSGR